METSYDILVVILSVALSVLLLLSIVFMYFLVKFIRTLNEISASAQEIVDNVESASKIFERSATPVAMTRIVSNVVEMFRDDKSNSKRKGKK